MKVFIKFLRTTGVYLIGNVLIKAVTFFMLPLYTKYITPSDYGAYDLYIAYISFLCSVLFLDIWSGILRFMFDFKDENDKAKPIFVGLIIFFISSIAYSAVLLVLDFRMNIEYIWLLYIYGLLMNLQNVFGYIARGYSKSFLYAISGIIGAFVTVICNIMLLVYFKMSYEALYISSCAGFLASICTIFWYIKPYKIFRIKHFDKLLFKTMYVYVAPLCLNSVSYWFLTSYNKLVVSSNLTLFDNGLYAVAGKFGVIINLFTSCFQMAWQELSFSKAELKKEEMERFYSTAVNEYVKFLCMGLILLLPIIHVVFPIMVDEAYYGAINIIPFYLLAALSSSISSFLSSIFSTLKKTNVLFTTTMIGSLINVICIHLLIGRIGLQAASISLFIGFTVNVGRRISVLNKYIDIKIDYRFLLIYCIPFIMVYFIYAYLSNFYNIFIALLLLIFAIYKYRSKLKTLMRS